MKPVAPHFPWQAGREPQAIIPLCAECRRKWTGTLLADAIAGRAVLDRLGFHLPPVPEREAGEDDERYYQRLTGES